ncbi:MAG: FtsX-like permease family protein, partial [Candidatus Bathyarchaeia archaeon]
TWKWTATGEYLWYWEERVIKRIFLEEYPTRQLVDEIATINRRVHEEVYEELQDFLRTLNRLDESGYDISNLQVLTKRLEIIYPFIVQLTSECKVEEAKPLFLQAKGISYQLQSLINFIHTGALLSVVITMLLLCLFSVFLGSFVAKGWLRYLIESLIFFTLALLFLHHQPDLYYSMKYLLPSDRLLRILTVKSGWDIFALVIMYVFFLTFRTTLHMISERASSLASSANMAVQWIKRRKKESLLVLFTIFLIASTVTTLTTTILNYESSVSHVRHVDRSLTAMIIYPRHRFSEIDPWFCSAQYVQVASTLFYNPTGIISGTTFFHIYKVYKEGERDGGVILTGAVGLEPLSSNYLYNLSEIILEGRWLQRSKSLEVLISHNLAKTLGIKIGESIEIFDTMTKITLAKYLVVGIFDFEKAMKVEELNGYPLFGDLEFIGENFIITSTEDCKKLSKGLSATRQASLTILLAAGYDVMDVANVFLSNGYRIWIVKDGLAKQYSGDVVAVTKGLEYHLIIVLMGSLMVLNVMLTSVYQRRGSILTMTCIGLNPSQIRNIFIIESLSLVAVSYLTGYISALLLPSFLKTLPYIGVFFGTYSYVKTGPIYPILTIGIILFISILGGYIPARNAMTITTPSRELRWSFEVEDLKDGSFRAYIPIFLKSSELELFHEFITNRGKIYGDVVSVTMTGFEKSGKTYIYFFESQILTATDVYSKVKVEFVKKGNTWIPSILFMPSRVFTPSYKRSTVEIFRRVFLEYSDWKERKAKSSISP